MTMKMSFSLLLLLASVAVISINAVEKCILDEEISLMELFCGSCGDNFFDITECGKLSSRVCSGGVDPLPSYCSICENAQVTDWEEMGSCRTALHEYVRSLPGCDEMNTFCSSCWGGTNAVCNSDDDIDEFCENPIYGVDAPTFCQDSSCKNGDHSEGCRLSASRYHDTPGICYRPDLDGEWYTTSKGGSKFGGVPSSVVSSTGTTFKMPTADLTVELWVMPDTIGDDDQTLVSYATLGPGDNTLKWCVDAYGDLRIHTKNSDWHTGVHLAYGAWRHLAFTYDASSGERKVYLDGFQASTSTSVAEGLPSLGSLYLGQAHTKPGEELSVKAGQSFGGCLGEFRVWSVVRTADEVKASMDYNVPPHDNLMHRYSFGPHKGKVLLDLGRESQDLTARGLERCATRNTDPPPVSRFKGPLSWVYAPKTNYKMPTSTLTVEVWAKADIGCYNRAIFSYAGISNDGDKMDANAFLFFIGEFGHLEVTVMSQSWKKTGTYLADDEWHHVAVTYDASSRKGQVFLDGHYALSHVFPAETKEPYGTGVLYLGQEQDSVGGHLDPTQSFLGCIREVRVWDVARTADEIMDSMTRNVANHPTLMHLYGISGHASSRVVEDFGYARHDLQAEHLARCGSAVRFQGNSASRLSSATGYSMPTTALTVEMWIKAGVDSKGTALFSYATEEQGANTFLLYITEDGVLEITIPGRHWGTISDDPLIHDEWQHLAVTYAAAGRGEVFVDGEITYVVSMGALFGQLSPVGVLYLGQEQDSFGGHLADNQAFRGCLRGELRVWDVVRTAEEIKASMKLSVYPHDNLMHLYKLDGTILQGSVEDFGTAGQALTARSLMPCGKRAGPSRFLGNSNSWLSSTDYYMPDATGATGYSMPTTALTVEMWIKAGVDAKGTALFSYATEAQGDDTFLLFINKKGGRLELVIKAQPWNTGIHLMFDEWQHLAVTYAASGKGEVYVDGELRKDGESFTGGDLSSLGALYVGQEQDRNVEGGLDETKAFRGCLRGELRVWDVVRTGEEIKASMKLNVVPHANLMHLYRFEGPFLQGSVEDFGTAGQALTAQSLVPCESSFHNAPGVCTEFVPQDPAKMTFCESCAPTEQYPNYYSLTPECYLDSYLLCLTPFRYSYPKYWCDGGYTSPFDKSDDVLRAWSDKIKVLYLYSNCAGGENEELQDTGDSGGGNDSNGEEGEKVLVLGGSLAVGVALVVGLLTVRRGRMKTKGGGGGALAGRESSRSPASHVQYVENPLLLRQSVPSP